jgi:hypothetical protein
VGHALVDLAFRSQLRIPAELGVAAETTTGTKHSTAAINLRSNVRDDGKLGYRIAQPRPRQYKGSRHHAACSSETMFIARCCITADQFVRPVRDPVVIRCKSPEVVLHTSGTQRFRLGANSSCVFRCSHRAC